MKIFTTETGIKLSKKYANKLDYNNRWFFDKNALLNQINNWFNIIPWIKPYYAIKSNTSNKILKVISSNKNIGLDIASLKETEIALKYMSLENTIYTNPHTIPHESSYHMKYQQNIKVIDSILELDKLINYNINYPLLIRLKSTINSANCKFDLKFGSNIEEAIKIIDKAQKNNYIIKGISFHIGSGGDFNRKDAYIQAYTYAIPILKKIKEVFSINKPILNIGGGLLPNTDLNEALGWTKDLIEEYDIIAEPGRYFSEPSFNLATQVICKNQRGIYLDNGIYHELNVYHRDHWNFPKLTHFINNYEKKIIKIIDKEYEDIEIFGPTCDNYDTLHICSVPININIGDWIFLTNMGAYSNEGALEFNGIKMPSKK
jgi:ornithine decarboxylase